MMGEADATANHLDGALVADIGGTNARFALLDAVGRPAPMRVLACADFADFQTAMRGFLAEAAPSRAIARAAVAVASPVIGDRIEMTNHDWSFSIAAIKAEFGLAALHVVNDFTAAALAVPELDAGDLVRIGGGVAVADAPVAVLGPGTGLGVSGLVPSGSGWIPLAGEGGHVTLAACDAREAAVVAEIARRFGHASVERAVSGPGLVNLHAALSALDDVSGESPTADRITEAALAGSDPICVEALDMFFAMLGTAAGNLALSLGALGGVYIGGGIVPKLSDAFAASRFRERFEAKGRFRDYMRAIPTYLIMRETPALLGLATLLRATG